MEKILVIVAHPDDEILGCGGTIAKLKTENKEVRILILSQGMRSRDDAQDRNINALQEDAKEASKIIGSDKLLIESFPDNSFDSVPMLEIIKKIESIIEEFKPDTVFTHSGSDLNIDHKITCEAVKVACRPMEGTCVKRLLAFEVPSSTEWGFLGNNSFHPNKFIDISGTLDKKLEAMSAYKGELREFPHPRSLEYMESLAKVRGGGAGYNAAEAFELVFEKE
ncbi:MAG: PIG-L deacetylase family protein [Patescibacteria group bacterium]|nr:PIG-L family deacetylase [Patescibacteria group bacterium]